MYDLVRLPESLPKIDFSSFKDKEAKAYLVWFIGQIPARIAVLEREVKSDFPSWSPDFSHESLLVLDQWLLLESTISKMDNWNAKAQSDHSMSNHCGTPIQFSQSQMRLSDYAVSICFDLGLYLGESLRKANPKFNWSYRLKPKNYIYYAEPILVADEAYKDFCPRFTIGTEFNYTFQNDLAPSPIMVKLFEYNKNR
jgi:hypothetical protein